jgi:hypothetical protein
MRQRPAPARAPAPLGNAAITSGSIITIDDALRQIGDLIPGFGGLYVNDADELVIRLRDSTDSALPRAAVFQVLGRIPGRRGGQIRIQSAEYTFAELQGWMRQILRSIRPDGIVEADINERDNRVTLGVEDEAVIARIRQDLVRIGVPVEAVTIRRIVRPSKVSANDSLTSVSTPVVGGVMVQAVNFPQGGAKPHCTAGFNAWLLPDTVQLYLVTNDHCTWQMGGVTGDTLWQSNWAGPGSRPIAIKVASAQYRTLPDSVCFGYTQCRYSDAALFRYINSSDGLLGSIARPLDFSHGTVPFTLVRDTADFLITGDLPRNRLTVQGEWMSKIGVTTGWSVGKVDATCLLAQEVPRIILCASLP